jgi:cell division protein ZapE
VFGAEDADIVRRFTWLVDEFYDRRVKLIASAAAQPADLYPYVEGGDQFQRTISRMTEMQTRAYLSEPHLP